MNKKSFIFIAVSMLACVFLFQNCGDGFEASSGSGSSLFSSQDNSGTNNGTGSLPYVNCQEHTSFVACSDNTALPQVVLANGCPAYACNSVIDDNVDVALCEIPDVNETQIKSLYLKWFSRSPDDAGVCYHYEQFVVHQSLIQLELNLVSGTQEADTQHILSNEALRVMAINLFASNDKVVPNKYLSAREIEIVGLFLKWFDRSPMADGLVYWAGQSFTGVELENALVRGAQTNDRNHINSGKAQLFRNFCAANNFDVPDWVN